MIIRCLLIIHLLNIKGYAQDFDGVYSGKIFSPKNVFVLSTTSETAIGTIHLNRTDKVIFMGAVSNSKLIGSVQSNNQSWNVSGELKGDTLLLTLTSSDKTIYGKLGRVSHNSKYNVNKLLVNKAELNLDLVGTWKLIESVKVNGDKVTERITQGFTYQFLSNGSCVISSPSLDEMLRKSKLPPPKSRWETIGSNIIITTGDSKPMNTESTYEIKGDSLYLTYKGTKSLYLKVSK